MSSLIANQMKTNMFYFFFYFAHYLCATVQTYNTYTTITIRSLFLSDYNFFASHTWTLFCTQLRCSNTQLHKILTDLQKHSTFYIRRPLVFRIFSKQQVRVLAFSRILSWQLVHVQSHTRLSRMLVGGGLFERCSIYLLVCIVYTLPLVALDFVVFALSIFFTLMIFVFVAFVYCS